jgi:hypothetical protein
MRVPKISRKQILKPFGMVWFKFVFGFALAVLTEEDPYL